MMYDSLISKELHRKVFELTLALYRVTDFFPQREPLRTHLRGKANEVFGGVSEYGHAMDIEREAIRIVAKIEAMRGYLDLAREHRFVRPVNIAVLTREYDFLSDFFMRELEGVKKNGHGKGKEVFNEYGDEEKTHDSPAGLHDSNSNKHNDDSMAKVNHDVLADATIAITSDNNQGTRNNRRFPKQVTNTPLNERQKKIVMHLKKAVQARISDFSEIFNEISSKTIQRDLQDMVSKNMLKKEGEKRWTTYYLTDNVL